MGIKKPEVLVPPPAESSGLPDNTIDRNCLLLNPNTAKVMQTKHIVRVREDRKKELCEPEQFKALFGPFRCKREVLTKTLLVMRLTSILLLVTCLHLSAKSRAQRITLTETRSSLKKVFKEITGQTGYLFVYRDEWLRQAQQVDITVQDASLQQVLEICFSDQPFTYVIIDKMVVLKQKPE